MANENLGAAKKAKQDEFYTQYADIEKEMNAYLEYNPDVFRGKTILLPCDDPEWSNFTRYFAQNFETFGLKKLISTSYAPNSKPIDVNYQPPLFEIESEKFDEEKTRSNGKIFTLTQDVTGDQKINVDDLEWSYLEGDGDFRSDEITKPRDEADFIITNPPFSLFRTFWEWVIESKKYFVILGNMNAITYKEVFPFLMNNEAWAGTKPFGGGMNMIMPSGSFEHEKAGNFTVDAQGLFVKNIMGVIWFTNIEHGKRHEPLPLMTMSDNIKFSKHKEVKGLGYHKYDNFDAIDVPFLDAIPSDFDGTMGVPITFLGKYSPEQFEIVGDSQTMASELGIGPVGQEFVDLYYSQGNKGQIGASWPYLVLKVNGMAIIPYKRILIRHRGSNENRT